MGVYIKDMEMPKSCLSCPLQGGTADCRLTQKTYNWGLPERPSDCPLVPAPPHGGQVMACKCYHAERNFVGEIGVCWGTKEREACLCGGDESKCDFYEDKRKKATPKPITHADRIRAMSDEELAHLLHSAEEHLFTGNLWNYEKWTEWLKQEASE